MKFSSDTYSRLVRFGAVGLLVMVFFMAANGLLGRWLGGQGAFLAAYPLALLLHYHLNKWWSFADPTPTDARKVGDYLHTVVVTFLVQWPIFTFLGGVLGWPGWLAAGCANLAQMGVSFVMLQWRVFRVAGAGERLGGARESWQRLLTLLLTVAVSVLLVWTVMGKWEFPAIGSEQSDYYNRLWRGFERGTLALDLPVPVGLTKLAEPWDPRQRPEGLQVPPDVSYANGNFYLYFGVAPVVTLFGPFKLLTGQELPFPYGLAVFILAAFWLLSALWLRVVHDHFPAAGWVTRLGGVLAFGLLGGLPILARRANFWELPIAAGQCFIALMLGCAYGALRSSRPAWWLAGAGLCLGLAVGSRPTLAVAGLALVVLVLVLAERKAPFGKGKNAWFGVVVARAWPGLAPLAVCMGALGAYNAARFGSPFEFGLNYQLTSVYEAKAQHFSPTYAGFNFRAYFWAWPDWDRYFPFLVPPELPRPPAGHYTAEWVYGLLWTTPVLWLGLWWWRRAVRQAADEARVFAAVVLGAAVPVAGLLMCFNTAVSRYTADFLPALLFIVMIAWAAREAAGGSMIRSCGVALVLSWSVLTAFFASAALHGMLAVRNPEGYRALERVFNTPVAWVENNVGGELGPIDLALYFSVRPGSGWEPLLTVGRTVDSSAAFHVEHLDGDLVRFRFEMAGQAQAVTEAVKVERGRRHHLRFECGALYPPVAHPFFAGRSEMEVASLQQWVRIALNGKILMDAPTVSSSAASTVLGIGSDARRYRSGSFSGVIVDMQRAGIPEPLANFSSQFGDLSLAMKLPPAGGSWPAAFTGNAVEQSQPWPLVVIGQAGSSQLLAVETMQESVRFHFERWGGGVMISRELPLGPERSLALRIRMGALLGLQEDSPLGLLRHTVAIWRDGVPAIWWRADGDLPQGSVAVGRNEIGSTAATHVMRGRLAEAQTVPVRDNWKSGPFSRVALLIGGRGAGRQPLVGTGLAGAADTLAVDWTQPGRARLIYDHWGREATMSPEFDWPEESAVGLEIELPSFSRLDAGSSTGEGKLRIWQGGRLLWQVSVQYHPAKSATVAIGRNPAGSSVASPELTAVLLDARQFGEQEVSR